MSILLDEDDADELFAQASLAPCSISAATVVEVIVSCRRKLGADGIVAAYRLLEDLKLEIAAFDADQARIAGDGFNLYGMGRGAQPSALNFGDCFSYALAKSLDVPLLFKGVDFAKTDVKRAV